MYCQRHVSCVRIPKRQAFSGDWEDIIPVTPCHWDEIIPVDGRWLPQWDEALDELTGQIEVVYFASYSYVGRSPPL